MRTFASLLFVPAHRRGWAEKAVASGAHAIILDLEDSVPAGEKVAARERLRESVTWLREHRPGIGVLLRPNALDTGLAEDDIERCVMPGVDALLLPMVRSAGDVADFADLLDDAERRWNLGPGQIGLIPSLETAQGLANCESLATSSPRIHSLQAAVARGGDIEREVGFEWTAEGLETLYLRSRVVLACRANGLRHPLVGVWQDINDLDGLHRFSSQNRQLGFRGQLVIHPSHVATVNRVFGDRADELDRYRRMIAAYDAAAARGLGAVDFEGEHIDIAHVKTAMAAVATDAVPVRPQH